MKNADNTSTTVHFHSNVFEVKCQTLTTSQKQRIQQMERLRTCSHEPGTVNYPGVMIARSKRYLAFTR